MYHFDFCCRTLGLLPYLGYGKKNAAVGLGVPLCFQNVESDVSTATTVMATQEGSQVQKVRGGVQL